MKSWVEEVEDRTDSLENICSLIKLIDSSVERNIEKDTEILEFIEEDEVPKDFKKRKLLSNEIKKLAKVCYDL